MVTAKGLQAAGGEALYGWDEVVTVKSARLEGSGATCQSLSLRSSDEGK